MSNKYFSQEQRLLSRGVYTGAINPPADFGIAKSSDYKGMFYPSLAVVNMYANAIVKSIGLYCNFADGLVFALPSQPLILNLSILGFASTGGTLLGTSSSISNMNGLHGAGTSYDTQLVAGDYIRSLTSKYIYKVKTVTDADDLVLYGYYPQTISSERFEKLSVLGTLVPQGIVQINTLNEMYPITLPSMQSLFASNSFIRTFTLEINLDIEATSGVTFLTKSVDTSYAADTVTFDGAIDFEFTPV